MCGDCVSKRVALEGVRCVKKRCAKASACLKQLTVCFSFGVLFLIWKSSNVARVHYTPHFSVYC